MGMEFRRVLFRSFYEVIVEFHVVSKHLTELGLGHFAFEAAAGVLVVDAGDQAAVMDIKASHAQGEVVGHVVHLGRRVAQVKLRAIRHVGHAQEMAAAHDGVRGTDVIILAVVI